ncbi:hypothetical protein HZA96_05300 [Candidatus Woesearchaeota archaeon]|nr:hypothetical protein [Candidatus Woesearchaeota archaeon]
MKKRYELLLTEEQEKKLQDRAEALGFSKKSDYIRFMVFMELSFMGKIDQIHKKVCLENAGKN